ncbi:MAG: hypothetical protein ABIL09_18890 [Gemmatimonadota bacterium]
MLWILVVVLLGLLVVMAQLLLVYQKRAHELRLKMEPIRRRIRDHRQTMGETFARLRERSSGRLEQLDAFLARRAAELEQAEGIYEELLEDRMLATPEEPDPEAVVIDENYDPEFEAAAAAARDAAREVVAAQESLDHALNDLGRDRDLIRRTLERMQAQFGEELGTPSGRRRREAAG